MIELGVYGICHRSGEGLVARSFGKKQDSSPFSILEGGSG
jgi:hypothetical protein